MKLLFFFFLLSLCTVFHGQVSWAADPQRGALVAKARCATCHHLNRNIPLIGPSLQGIFGRSPTISGVPFSRWGEKELDAWISNPRKIKPNTKMHTPPIAKRDRVDVIAYFKEQR